MHLSLSHAAHDPDPKRPRRGSPEAEDPGGPGRPHAVGSPGARGAAPGRAADDRRDARAPPVAAPGQGPRPARRGRARGARSLVIVADASAVLELLIGTAAAERVADRLLAPDEALHAPHLLDVEVAQAVRRYVAAGDLDAAQGERAIADLLDLPIRRHPHTLLLRRVWELRDSITAYDGVYVALAEALRAPLVTRDGRLARAHGHRARIELL